MLLEAGSGHSAGSLGMADVFAALYFGQVLKYDPKNPWMEDRDQVIFVQWAYLPGMVCHVGTRGIFPT